ncbi:MAG TPA: bifunctional 4-hydroxy-2-oxoglutarate aldolase/2-dehydro-3-deoxy-phosphogluconate aldolase [Thermomicrobiales bacterium]|nr:bifunctional 4-hydroxy-2-oxoglutarate aldolase/2-dehydro-3-deoxy-phosphogluconate aldolase [Thermomicrobiales bacterium]
MNTSVQDRGIVAVVRLDDLSTAVDVAQALIAGGVTAIEYTFTNPKAAQAISDVREAVGASGYIGAGTILDSETARIAILAGAEYIVTPTFKPATVELCNRYGIPTVVGAFTSTEMLTAWEAGSDYIKVHPASLGGPKYFKDVLAPLPFLRLIPSGGVTPENAADFIKAGAVAVAMGSNLVDKDSVTKRDWTTITQRATSLSASVKAAIAAKS